MLAWLLDEAAGPIVAAELAAADTIVTSELTLIECDRAILRRRVGGGMSAADVAALRHRLEAAGARWGVEPMTSEVATRARAPFSDDRLRTLDAIHLATAVVARDSLGDLDVLSLDERVRANAAALGFRVLPA